MIPKVSLEGCCEGETTDQKNKLNSPYSMSGFFCCFFFHVEIYGQRNISGDSSKKVVPCKEDRNCP